MKSILFVCTGNIFRSMTAEYILKGVLGTETVYTVSSAGTEAIPYEMFSYVREHLRQYGIDPSGHRQRRVTAELLNGTDLVVAMGLDHRQYLRERFGREARLFNEICFGKEESVLDMWEAVPNYQQDHEAMVAYCLAMVDYVYEAMPYFIKNAERYFAPAEVQDNQK